MTKYLVQFTENTTLSTRTPVSAIFELVENTRPYLEDLRKRERIVDYGFYGTGHGFYAVIRANNLTELHEMTQLVPMRPFCNVESTPVMDGGDFAECFNKIKRECMTRWERVLQPKLI